MKASNIAKNLRLTMTGFALAFAVIACLGSAVPAHAATPALPASNHVNGGPVEMKSTVDSTGNLRLDVKGGGSKIDTPMQIYKSNHSGWQQFEIKDAHKTDSAGRYYYYIRVLGSNLYLSNLGKKDNGTPIVQTHYTGSNAQQWSMHRVANGTYFFINRDSGKALDVKNGTNACSTPVVQHTYNGSAAQKWSMELVPVVTTSPTTTTTSRTNNPVPTITTTTTKTTTTTLTFAYEVQKTIEVTSVIKKETAYETTITTVTKKYRDITPNGKSTTRTTLSTTTSAPVHLKTTNKELILASAKGEASTSSPVSKVINTLQNKTNEPKTPTKTTSTPKRTAANATCMTAEEKLLADKIFTEYNKFRKSKGLKTVKKDASCTKMAFKSATGCAKRGSLTHRLGIAKKDQKKYSDILQYSTWKKSASSTVKAWKGSTGHRKMMQCKSATKAGVACFNDNGTWFYVIVYNFSGTNQSGK